MPDSAACSQVDFHPYMSMRCVECGHQPGPAATFPICPRCGGGIWPSGHSCPEAVVCPACERRVEGTCGPLPRKPGSYVHVCGATFTINDDGTVSKG